MIAATVDVRALPRGEPQQAGMDLTARQTLIWLDHELFPDVPIHTLVLTVELEGALDADRLAAAFADLVAGSDALRLTVERDRGKPLLRLLSQVTAVLERVDLSREPTTFRSWLDARVSRPFSTGRPMFGASLIRLAVQKHVLVVLVDHLIADGVSLLLIVSELCARYTNAPVAKRASYLEYLEAERAYRSSPRAREHSEYWAKKLRAGVPPAAFYGRPRTERTFGVERIWRDLGRERFEQLRARATAPPLLMATPAMSRMVALATVLFAYLYRVTQNRELAIGAPIQNRLARFRQTIGLLMEQPILCTTISEDETFESLSEKVRAEIFESLRRSQHCLSDRGIHYTTLNVLGPEPMAFGDLSARVDFRPAAVAISRPSGVEADLRDTFALQVHESESRGELGIGFEFHRDTFEPRLRERAANHFLALFDAFLVHPKARIDTVDLLAEPERRTLIERGRGPEPDQAPPRLLKRLRAEAARRPDHPAIVTSEGALSYAELEARTNQLARMLVSLFAHDGARVGIYVSRGADELLSILGVLKAGGCYVPLDPTHPAERVRLILDDAAPEVLIAHRRELAGVVVPDGVRLLLLDEEWTAIQALDAASLPRMSPPSAPAYVLFTSGSTGRPKGVEITLGGLENFLASMARSPGLTENDRLLAITTITFDIAGLELLLPLWVGATVRIAGRETALDPRLLASLLDREPITVMQATPATWRLLLEAGWTNPSKIKMLCGGEALAPELARALIATGGELWNLYGPTETTVWSTLRRIEPDFERITIGRPIDRTELYVLDSTLHLVPEGLPGELCIGGAGLARGYLKRPELTAERFVPNPYGAPHERLYRTGDLARWLPSGDMECLGRLDHQVKIRGFRIELGEIESVLRAVPGVRDAVVLARTDEGAADPRLVAYVVSDGSVEHGPLTRAARERLPAYMNPSAYVTLPEFPLTTTGKIDRKALPAPNRLLRISGVPKRLPQRDVETRMALAFRAVLGIDRVGIDENFFDLGGTSPLAIELIARVNAEFRTDVPLRVLFETPTIEGLVARLGERAARAEPLVIPLRQGNPNRPALFCLLGVTLYHDLADALPAGTSVYGLHVPMRYIPADRARATVVEIAARYVSLIRETRPHGPYHLAGLCFGGLVAFETAQQLVRSGERVETVSLFDAFLPRALHVHAWRRARAIARDLADLPSIRRRALGLRERLADRLVASRWGPFVQRWIATSCASAASAERELNLIGPETFTEARVYQARARPFPGPLLVFRATARAEAPWIRLDRDLGWKGMSPDLRVYEVPGDHLGIVRDPHVSRIADALGPLLVEGVSAASGARTKD